MESRLSSAPSSPRRNYQLSSSPIHSAEDWIPRIMATEESAASLLLLESLDPGPLPNPMIQPEHVDLRSLSFVADVDKNLLCPICHSAIIEPILTKCKHSFCFDCLDKACANSPTCPVDRLPLDMNRDTTPVGHAMANMLDELKVYCPSIGCQEVISRGDIQNHVDKYCGYVEVWCNALGCRKIVFRKDSSQCQHDDLNCASCGEDMIEKDLDAIKAHHTKDCPSWHTSCMVCRAAIPKTSIEDHKATCPEETAACPGALISCSYKCKRKDMPQHAAFCIYSITRGFHKEVAKMLNEQNARITTIEARHRQQDQRSSQGSSRTQVAQGSTFSSLPSQENLDLRMRCESHLNQILAMSESIRDNLVEFDARQTMMLTNESLGIKEELAEIRAALKSSTLQLRWLMAQTQLQPQIGNPVSSGTAMPPTSGRESENTLARPSLTRPDDVPRQEPRL
ncbi:MAG: hypothetical protein M1829_004575 [Trizodia sp. TS-e1964]|nr:MAG: hypothetical protein M1829_004575 [Trizodia sp. TS-e1964]